jgi:hypothetical protein
MRAYAHHTAIQTGPALALSPLVLPTLVGFGTLLLVSQLAAALAPNTLGSSLVSRPTGLVLVLYAPLAVLLALATALRPRQKGMVAVYRGAIGVTARLFFVTPLCVRMQANNTS